MSHLIPETRRARRGATYSREELEVISKYKDEYKEQTTRPLRAHVLRNKILVDLFNYWWQENTLPTDEEGCVARVKVTCYHIDIVGRLMADLGTCCMDSKQLATKCQCVTDQFDHEVSGH